jgi:hypothetical protein
LVTQAERIVVANLYFNVNLLEDYLKSLRWYWGIVSSLTFNNATSNITYVYNDATGVRVNRGCLNVTRRTVTSDEVVCANCSASSGSTLTCSINTNLSGIYLASGSIETTSNSSVYVIETLSVDASKAYLTFGSLGIFLTMIYVMVISLIGIFSVPVAVVLTLVGLITSSAIGLTYISYSSIVIFIFIGLIFIMRSKQ